MSELVYRQATIDLNRADDERRTVEASLSSEFPVDRSFGREVLVHTAKAVDLSRAPFPLLTSHDTQQTPVGIVESLKIAGGKLRGVLRFSSRADGLWEDVKAGVLRHISIGYQILEGKEDADGIYRATKWMPYEVSLVSVPADPTVGIGRSHRGNNMSTETIENDNEKMTRSERRREKHSLQREIDRAEAINRLAELYNADPAMTREFIASDRHPDEFRKALRDAMPPAPPNRQLDSTIGMSGREIENYSFVRAIRGQLDPKYAMREGGLELEASQAMARMLGREPQGVFIPVGDLSRDLSVGTATAGGHTVATDLLASDFIAMLRNRVQVIRAGAKVMSGLVGNVAIPRQTSSSTAYWVSEGSVVTESQQAFDQISMTPKTVGGYTDFTRKLMLQSSMDIENLVRSDLATVVALEIDRAAINGSGSGSEPTGILNTTGIGDVAGGANGLAPTYEHIVDLLSAIAAENADQGALGFITNSAVRGKLLKTTKVSGDAGAGFVWEPGMDIDVGRMLGFRAAVSNQVPSDLDKGSSTGVCSAILFGAWDNLLIGEWGGLDLMVDPYSLSNSGSIRVVALQDIDIAVRHAEAFAAMQDALTT